MEGSVEDNPLLDPAPDLKVRAVEAGLAVGVVHCAASASLPDLCSFLPRLNLSLVEEQATHFASSFEFNLEHSAHCH